MAEKGLIQVENPSQAFMVEHEENIGSTIVPILEGNRPLLVEIQGLTSPSNLGNPRRTPNGVEPNRLLLTTAVLARRVGLRLVPLVTPRRTVRRADEQHQAAQ